MVHGPEEILQIRIYNPRFLQTPPHDDALALR